MYERVSIDNSPLTAYYSAHPSFRGSLLVPKDSLRLVLRLAFLVLCLGLVISSSSVQAGTGTTDTGAFPGQGDYHSWLRANALYDKADEEVRARRYDQAVSNYRAAIDVYPYDGSYFYNLALILKEKKDFKQAEKCFRKSTELSPSRWIYWAGLGDALKHEGQAADARGAYAKASRLNPPPEIKTALEKAARE